MNGIAHAVFILGSCIIGLVVVLILIGFVLDAMERFDIHPGVIAAAVLFCVWIWSAFVVVWGKL